ncbi:myb-binding protein 1A [Drosophila navojoa]|uniref:myb-binding protein 1A n=1 Tax=Drosophila navojoa TaxID=7232 RepID=UPI000846CA90|nr:myb-binding protein 1A [Drosophila navojoa]
MPEEQKENKIDNEQPQLQANAKNTGKRPNNEMDAENENVCPKKRNCSAPDPLAKKEQNAEVLVKQENILKSDLANINKNIFRICAKLLNDSNQHKHQYVEEMIKLFSSEKDLTKRTATVAYALKRLIRCTGADNMGMVVQAAGYIRSIFDVVPDLNPIDMVALMKHELPCNGSQKGKEESLAGVGQLITVLSFMKSKYFVEPSTELLLTFIPVLASHLNGREYLTSMCADILGELFDFMDVSTFGTSVWSVVKPALNMPITAHKQYTCDLLLKVHVMYPTVLSLPELEGILWRNQSPQYEQLFALYMNPPTIFKYATYKLGHFLSACSNEQALEAWMKFVDEKLPTNNIAEKCLILSTLTGIVSHVGHKPEAESRVQLKKVFGSKPLVAMMIEELKDVKKNATKKKSLSNNKMDYFCHRLQTSMAICLEHILQKDDTKLEILRPMLEQELNLDSISLKPQFICVPFGCLSTEGLDHIYDFYFHKFTSNNEEMKSSDRVLCLKKMQNIAHSKRDEHLAFLYKAALFNLNDKLKKCTAADASVFSRQAASLCEEAVFNCLVHKLSGNKVQLKNLNKVLRTLLLEISRYSFKPGNESKLRIELTPELRTSWENVLKIVKSDPIKQKGIKTYGLIFDTLLMFVAAATLLKKSTIDLDIIDDLVICKENAIKSKSQADESSPKWQSVVTDVLIQLLLQTGNYWRQFINSISVVLMPYLEKDNLKQILDFVDVDKNPFEDSSDGDDNDDDDADVDNDDDDDDVDNDQDEEEDDDEDKASATEIEEVRERVRKALLGEPNSNDDNDSIDWNDVDEEEGERLNKALEAAFQMNRKSKGNSQQGKGSKKRPPKSVRITETTLLHLRVRVFDLVEEFAKAQPKQEIILDSMACIQKIFNKCSKEVKFKPLIDAAKRVMRQLTKQDIVFETPDEDKTPLVDYIKSLLDQLGQKSKTPLDDVTKLTYCSIAHLVSQFNDMEVTDTPVWTLINDAAINWSSHRNSKYTFELFNVILCSKWKGIPQLMITFSAQIPLTSTNTRRREQIIELILKHYRRAFNKPENLEFARIIQKNIADFKPDSGHTGFYKLREAFKKLFSEV